MAPNKLKSGNGEGVCTTLKALCQVSLQSKFKFKKPSIKADNDAMDDEGSDDMGEDGIDGGGDIADIAGGNISDDEIDDFGGDGGP